jgi:hypothetical protein
MSTSPTISLATTYFDGEGRPHLQECVRLALDWAVDHGVATVVMFTGTGEGPHFAAKEFLPRERYAHLHVAAVTPPTGRPYRKVPGDDTSPIIRAGISKTMRDQLRALGIDVVSAHLPFKETWDGKARVSEWTRVLEAYGVLGGGFGLCVQAILIACDAGVVEHAEKVVTMSADTAFVATACRTESFLSPSEGLLVDHIICRPSRYTISKRLHEALQGASQDTQATLQLALPAAPQLPPAQPAIALATPRRSQKKPTKQR